MQAIGTALARVTSDLSRGQQTVPSQRSTSVVSVTVDWTAAIAQTAPMTLSQARQISSARLPVLAACSEQRFDDSLRVVLAALPKRNSDELSGELLMTAYIGKLGGFPAEQLAFLWDAVLERCQWFPTIAECLKILDEWQRDDEALKLQHRAKSMVFWDNQARFEDTMAALSRGDVTQKEIDALPENWREIGEARGHLWLHDDGSYTLRTVGAPSPRHRLPNYAPPRCAACQDVGRVLTLDGDEIDCTCAREKAA